MKTLRCVRLSSNAYLPKKGSELAAGFDLHSAYAYTIPPHGKTLCFTDLQLSVPLGTYGRIAPRSGLTHNHFIDVGAGVIDYDYRGNVGVILFNFSEKEFQVKKGDCIAQLICEKISYPNLKVVKNLEDTARGSKGFGSSDVN
jgi:dUTP pyrophosphatase